MPSYNESMGSTEERAAFTPARDRGSADAADARSMSAAVLTKVAPAASQRILEDVSALAGARSGLPKESALDRLEAGDRHATSPTGSSPR